jgi:hypothetical protein
MNRILTYNGGDFEAINCLPPQNLIRNNKVHLTTEPPIYYTRCYVLGGLSALNLI